MGDSARSAPQAAPGAITRRERPRLPVDGFIDLLRPGDPRVTPSRPVGHLVMAGSTRIAPLVHVPGVLPAPRTHRSQAAGPATSPVPLALRPPAPPTAEHVHERESIAVAPPVQPEPLPSSRPEVATGLGPTSGPDPSGIRGAAGQRRDPEPDAARSPVSRSSSPVAQAIGVSTTGTGRAGTAAAANGSTTGVRLVRGRSAEAHTARYGARAVSTGDTVHLPDRHGPLGTPEADALLAHELVHVSARRRAPAADVGTPAARESEERDARAVESAVREGRVTAPRTTSNALAPIAQQPPLGSVGRAPARVGRREEPPRARPALAHPRDDHRPANPGRPATDPLAGRSSATVHPLAPEPDHVIAPLGSHHGSHVGPGGAFTTVSRASEAPLPAVAPSPDEQQPDGPSRPLADRLRDELIGIREREGGILDLSRW